jgi:hypothetical protein
MAEDLLIQDAAARFLGLSPITLEIWCCRGAGPRFVRLSHRAVRYRLSELIRFAETHEVEPTKKAAPHSVVTPGGANPAPKSGQRTVMLSADYRRVIS